MADFYGLEHVGIADGTANPKRKYDFRVVGGKLRRIRSTKTTAQALAIGDRLYAGRLPANCSLRAVSIVASASLGTATLSLGTTASPTKYVNAKTMTAADIPTGIGPSAATFIADPMSVDEELWFTVGVAGIAGGVVMASDLTYSTNN
jgi:hypothetical protein